MTPAIYQHWKCQQTEQRRRIRQIAARRASVAAPPLALESESEPAPPKKRRSE
jgi:hypothetical protein